MLVSYLSNPLYVYLPPEFRYFINHIVCSQKDQGIKKIAIVGGNARAIVLSGGGSAALKPSFFVSPYDGILKALGDSVEVTYSEGARGRCFRSYVQNIGC